MWAPLNTSPYLLIVRALSREESWAMIERQLEIVKVRSVLLSGVKVDLKLLKVCATIGASKKDCP